MSRLNIVRANTALTRYFLCFFLLCLFILQVYAEPADNNDHLISKPAVPLRLVFHDFGWNWLNSVTYNYGLNFAGAGLGTWAMIETGIDWKWRNVGYNNAWLANAGLPILFSGYLVPVLAPIPVYLAGLYRKDQKLQITALALVQALVITQSFHLPFKLITGRSMPGIISGVFFEPGNTRDERTEDFSGEFNWFKLDVMDGWPSGHTACAFSAAALISEIYHDKPLLKAGVYAYAVLMGVGVAVNAHWASDSVAGALIGYAVGKTVGKSFNHLLGKGESRDTLKFYITPNYIGVLISLP